MSEVRLLEQPDWDWRRSGPSPRAVTAFGVRREQLRRLPGGAGHTWTDGRLVLKPVGCVPEHTFVCEVYAAWRATTVRVPEPVPPAFGAGEQWSVSGWGAHVFVAGRDAHLLEEIEQVRETSDAFHDEVAGLPRPDFLDDRQDPWSHGDRLAFDEAEPIGDAPTLALIRRLLAHRAPITTPSQLVHGDVLPNVLLHDRLPPALIDWPPYFRPAPFARAVAVTDAVTFRGASPSMMEEWAIGPDWHQLLIRALLYRLGPTGIFALHDRLMGSLRHHVERVAPLVDALVD